MAGNLMSLSNNGIPGASQSVSKSGSDTQLRKDVGDLGKALQTGDVRAAQSAVASLKNAAPTQNDRTEFQNAVKALDQSVKAGDLKSAREAFSNFQQVQQKRTQQQLAAHQAPASQESASHQPVRQRQETEQIQKTNQRERARQAAEQSAEQSFITRQDLVAKETASKAQLGHNIDTTA